MKVQVTISDEMGARVDRKAKEFGVTRSALCAMAIGQFIESQDKGAEMLQKLTENLAETLAEKKPSV